MIVKGYGLELVRLRHEDIELVRNWRNAEHVNRFMQYREHITPEMQEQWFSSIDNIHNNYFIIVVNGIKIGLINGSQIDWDKMETGNGGIFIWDVDYNKTLIPLRASLLLTDLSFFLGMKKTYIKVLKDNSSAITYNLSLGYQLLPDQETNYNQCYVLTKENYFSKTENLKHTLLKSSSGEITVIIDDPGHASSKILVEKYNQLSEENKKEVLFIIATKKKHG
jgi:UDP-4-amino-4,6-dideoxy-N-acetyl-beta-L-altrosamine N-acetyltransferase